MMGPDVDAPPSKLSTLAMPWETFDRYERSKKDIAIGFLYSALLPGGGFFYAERAPAGLITLLATGAVIGLGLSDARRGQSADTEITILVIGKVIEYFLVADAIGEYNSELRISLKMSLAFSSMNVPQLRISFSF